MIANAIENYIKENKNLKAETISYLASLEVLFKTCPSVAKSIVSELKFQRSRLKLIASENYSSLPVQISMGNLLTDKYAEGYCGNRFYAGCENVDAIESFGIDLVKKIFNCDHANIQPHSGADANLLAFMAMVACNIDDSFLKKIEKKTLNALSESEYKELRKLTINKKSLGMSLNSGGHLTHGGARLNITARFFDSFVYDVNRETEILDYSNLSSLAKKIKPFVLIAGYSAYSRKINFAKMRQIAEDCGAILMVDMAHFAGLVAGKVFCGEENPIPYADLITSTTHKTLRGPRGGLVLCSSKYEPFVNKGCPLMMGGPLPHVMASKAIAFQEALDPSFERYAFQVVCNAKVLAETFIKRGLQVVSGGTENHIVILKLSQLGITGKIAESVLQKAGIVVNRNAIPFDELPWYTSGIRLGTPALTTLGMKEDEMREIAAIICDLLFSIRAIKSSNGKLSLSEGEVEEKELNQAKEKVRNLLSQYPLYPEIDLKGFNLE